MRIAVRFLELMNRLSSVHSNCDQNYFGIHSERSVDPDDAEAYGKIERGKLGGRQQQRTSKPSGEFAFTQHATATAGA